MTVTTKNDTDLVLQEINNNNKMCQALLATPHYQKLGAEGVFAIVEKARSIGVNPLDALNGGMYYVRGKVEMTAAMMNQLIRQNKHSVTKDKRSDDKICILHGRRADTGDTWVESFSMAEAVRAGLTICRDYKTKQQIDGPWQKFPRDMLFARALSRLARQLFPDIIKGCYVEGEIKDAPPLFSPKNDDISADLPQNDDNSIEVVTEAVESPNTITDEQYIVLEDWIGRNMILRQNILTFLKKKYNVDRLQDMPLEIYNMALQRAKDQHRRDEYGEAQQMGA